MGVQWRYQIRVYLPEQLAVIARTEPDAPVLQPLAEVLRIHDVTLVRQVDAFEAYVAKAEKAKSEADPLYIDPVWVVLSYAA